jgi:AmmeMemoRadiSam system protein B
MSHKSEIRAPAVAGRFYPERAAELETTVARLLGAAAVAQPAPHLVVVAPHAGYIYSGGVAGKVFAHTVVPRRVVVLAPNHTGRGARGAVWSHGAFDLPGGAVPVDEEVCSRLLAEPESVLSDDRDAHRHEHALEVELPFLRARRPDVTVTPIVLGPLDLDECLAVGRSLARVLGGLEEPALLVASTDMNHYLSDAVTRERDARALEPLLALDAPQLYHRVRDEDISMCGVVPTTAALFYARARGATRAELLGYATSGDAFGDRERVVGYAGVIID